MDKQLVQQVLCEFAEQAVPSEVDLWPTIRERLVPRLHRAPWMRLVPATGLGRLGLALASLLVFSLAAYAAGPAINRLLQKDERLEHLDLGLSQSLDLSQTIEDVTVAVQWAYADADRVLIGFAIRSSDGKRFEAGDMTLTEATGVTFPWQGTYGAEDGTLVGIFDNGVGLSTVSRTLDVHFTVYAAELVLPSQATLPTIESTTEAGAAQVQLQPMPVGAVVGPFTFDFSIPMASADSSR